LACLPAGRPPGGCRQSQEPKMDEPKSISLTAVLDVQAGREPLSVSRKRRGIT